MTLPFRIISTSRYEELKADHEYLKQYRQSYIEALNEIRQLKEKQKAGIL